MHSLSVRFTVSGSYLTTINHGKQAKTDEHTKTRINILAVYLNHTSSSITPNILNHSLRTFVQIHLITLDPHYRVLITLKSSLALYYPP